MDIYRLSGENAFNSLKEIISLTTDTILIPLPSEPFAVIKP